MAAYSSLLYSETDRPRDTTDRHLWDIIGQSGGLESWRPRGKGAGSGLSDNDVFDGTHFYQLASLTQRTVVDELFVCTCVDFSLRFKEDLQKKVHLD